MRVLETKTTNKSISGQLQNSELVKVPIYINQSVPKFSDNIIERRRESETATSHGESGQQSLHPVKHHPLYLKTEECTVLDGLTAS